MRKLATSLTILAALPFLMAADVYRWTDTSGVMNYSQRKPEGVNAVLISSSGQLRSTSRNSTRRGSTGGSTGGSTVPAPMPGTAATSSQPALSPEQQKMLDDLQAKEADRQTAYNAAREDNCARSRTVLQRLNSSGRIRVRAADGSQTILPEEERQRRISDAQQGIVDNCS